MSENLLLRCFTAVGLLFGIFSWFDEKYGVKIRIFRFLNVKQDIEMFKNVYICKCTRSQCSGRFVSVSSNPVSLLVEI